MYCEYSIRKETDNTSLIKNILNHHSYNRKNGINLIVSENRMSAKAQKVLGDDIHLRYAADFYAGNERINDLIDIATASCQKLFDANYVNLSPISGNMCVFSIALALTDPWDKIARIRPFFPGGGFPFTYELIDRNAIDLPFSDEDWCIDTDAAIQFLKKEKPPLVVLAPSIFVFPLPVREIAETVHNYGGYVVYDASHPLGLIAGGEFQNPLEEGADLVYASTHKTFPGPQGGIIFTNNQQIDRKISNYVNFRPLEGVTLVCNPHLARLASITIVVEETNWSEYAKQVIANARAIANTLKNNGIPLQGENNPLFSELTYCHQILPRFEEKESKRLRNKLYEHKILTDGFLRMGTAEVTRLGYKETNCLRLGQIISTIVTGRKYNINAIKEEINMLIKDHREIVL